MVSFVVIFQVKRNFATIISEIKVIKHNGKTQIFCTTFRISSGLDFCCHYSFSAFLGRLSRLAVNLLVG